jgi:hypothetical protein
VVLLPLDSDAACTILNCHSARKIAMFKYNPTKPQVIENKICEGTDCLNVAFTMV